MDKKKKKKWEEWIWINIYKMLKQNKQSTNIKLKVKQNPNIYTKQFLWHVPPFWGLMQNENKSSETGNLLLKICCHGRNLLFAELNYGTNQCSH